MKQAQFLSEDDANNEIANNLVKLKTQMNQRQQTAAGGSRGPSQMSNKKGNAKDKLTENSTTSSKGAAGS